MRQSLKSRPCAYFVRGSFAHAVRGSRAYHAMRSLCSSEVYSLYSRNDLTKLTNDAGRYFLKLAFRRIHERFASLDDNDDASCLDAAKSMLAKW